MKDPKLQAMFLPSQPETQHPKTILEREVATLKVCLKHSLEDVERYEERLRTAEATVNEWREKIKQLEAAIAQLGGHHG